MPREEISWVRAIGYTIVAFVGLGVISAAVAFGTVIAVPVMIVFLIYEVNRKPPTDSE